MERQREIIPFTYCTGVRISTGWLTVYRAEDGWHVGDSRQGQAERVYPTCEQAERCAEETIRREEDAVRAVARLVAAPRGAPERLGQRVERLRAAADRLAAVMPPALSASRP